MNTQKARRLGLSVHEAGWLLQKTEGQVRGMLRRGDLVYAVAGRRIDPASVRSLLEGDYALLVLDMVLTEDVTAPVPVRRYAPPQPLRPGALEFAIATGFFVPKEDVERGMDALACLRAELPRDEPHKSANGMFANESNAVRKQSKSV